LTREITMCDAPTLRPNVLYIERLDGDESQTFVVYGSKIWGFRSHYNGSKTVPCWKDGSCDGGCNEETLRENFLLQCYSQKKGKQVFLYLTPSAYKQLMEQKRNDVPLRGLTLRVRRTQKKQGRLYVAVDEHAQARRIVAEDINPKESIMRFLKVPMAAQTQGNDVVSIPLPIHDTPARPSKRLKALGG